MRLPWPGIRIDSVKAVLFGSSFSLGMALNDEDTFSARLNQQLGPVIYNAASIPPFNHDLHADQFIETARAVGIKKGITSFTPFL